MLMRHKARLVAFACAVVCFVVGYESSMVKGCFKTHLSLSIWPLMFLTVIKMHYFNYTNKFASFVVYYFSMF